MSSAALNLSEAERLNNDATGYRLSHLKRLRNSKKTERFNELIFLNSPVNVLNELFPFVQGKGQLNPTQSFRMSAARMNEWRQLTQPEQQTLIDVAGEEPPLQMAVEEPPPTPIVAPVAKRAKHQESLPAASASSVPLMQAPSMTRKRETPPRESKAPSVSSASVDTSPKRGRRRAGCRGISMETLQESVTPNDIGKAVLGFRLLVGEAMQYKVTCYEKNLSWPFTHEPTVVGAFSSRGRKAENNKSMNIKWLCYQSAAPAPALNNHSKTDEQKLDFISFHHTTCRGDLLMPGKKICESCVKEASQLFGQCRAAADEKGSSEQSAESMSWNLDNLQNEIRKDQQKHYELRKRGAGRK